MRPTLQVARELLGLYLVRNHGTENLVGKIVEVEAYLDTRDPASHTYRGKTKRNEVMFQNGGHLYVYFTYGMHYCANVVTERIGIGHAVLLRALQPIEGIETMRRNRNKRDQETDEVLCSGPARLCEALRIGRRENGTDLCGHQIWIGRDLHAASKPRIARSTRVGITRGKHHQWRFFLRSNLFISPGKPS